MAINSCLSASVCTLAGMCLTFSLMLDQALAGLVSVAVCLYGSRADGEVDSVCSLPCGSDVVRGSLRPMAGSSTCFGAAALLSALSRCSTFWLVLLLGPVVQLLRVFASQCALTH